jgi:tryptophan synthase beta subunit
LPLRRNAEMQPDDKLPDILRQIVTRRRERLLSEGPLLSAWAPPPGVKLQAPLPFLKEGGVICEIKRRSPSRGEISSIPDPAALAEIYRRNGAAAFSVLTEEDFFGGSLSDLAAVRRAVPGLPILRKDFLLSPEDLVVSRRFGADAVLLITRILDDSELELMFAEAARLGMTVLAEAHGRSEIRRLRPFAPSLVGINSRDLASFRVDPLVPAALASEIDWSASLVWESGVFGSEEAKIAAGCGFGAVLAGEGAVRNPRIIPEIAEALAGRPAQEGTGDSRFFWKELALRRAAGKIPLVKICGLTRLEDAETAAAAGADILGFILAPSPRRVEEETLRSIAQAAEAALRRDPASPFGRALRVGVIVEKRDGKMDEEQTALARSLLNDGIIHAVQLHGDADPGECAAIAFPYFKALRPSSSAEAESLAAAPGDGGWRSPRVLLDAFSLSEYGGTGRQADPAVIEAFSRVSGRPLWLAGGLNPGNAEAVIRRYRPELIDISSGIESAPGIKDPERIKALFSAIARSGEDYFGRFGGSYVAEVLRQPLLDLKEFFRRMKSDKAFLSELEELQNNYIGRPTPLLHAVNAGKRLGGADIYIKLEGLANTGAHKINNAMGQALLARRMGKRRIIAETGAGQHGLATAAACARLGLECIVYMGTVDYARQRPNVMYMEMFGARVVPVDGGSGTLKDAVNEALRDWAGSFASTHYLIGSALGPAPFPAMVEFFQSVIGNETAMQLRKRGVHPDLMVACVGGGSNAVGFFAPWLDTEPGDPERPPRLLGAEAGGRGSAPGEHAARMDGAGREGIFQGYRSMFLLDEDGQVYGTHSISAGLDYPGIGPRLAYAGARGRMAFTSVSDDQALEALGFFARSEGLLFALESAHAGYAAMEEARKLGPGKTIVINMSGRGDKDLFITAAAGKPEEWAAFLRQEAAKIEPETDGKELEP